MLPHDEHAGAYESTSGAMYDRPVDRFRRNLGSVFTDRVLWAVAGVVVLFFLFLLSGGLGLCDEPDHRPSLDGKDLFEAGGPGARPRSAGGGGGEDEGPR